MSFDEKAFEAGALPPQSPTSPSTTITPGTTFDASTYDVEAAAPVPASNKRMASFRSDRASLIVIRLDKPIGFRPKDAYLPQRIPRRST
jgi:hypothetical protein